MKHDTSRYNLFFFALFAFIGESFDQKENKNKQTNKKKVDKLGGIIRLYFFVAYLVACWHFCSFVLYMHIRSPIIFGITKKC